MREIKFRAWDAEKKKMTDEFIIKKDGSLRIWDSSGWGDNQYTQNLGSRLMQYTGLKDKDGKEIYEGDLIKFQQISKEFEEGEKWFVWKIEWNTWGACFDILPTDDMYSRDRGDMYVDIKFNNDYNFKMEVVGNIYENKAA